jgi:pimeloyl-ACP methyl ester carboxylesterase
MPYTTAPGLRLYYETDGPHDGRPLVLISGLGGQLIGWHDDFVAQFAAAGFRVIRLDNRDVGLSEMTGSWEDTDGGYNLEDMADDVVRVLDDAGVPQAHIAGHSMGGMIAQLVAIGHPGRVLSLGLISTIPGRDPAWVRHPGTPAWLAGVPPHRTRDEVVAASAASFGGDNGLFPFDRDWYIDVAGRCYDRSYEPTGYVRQWAACLRAPDRLERLRAVTVPSWVFHGRDDAGLAWRAAVDMAEALPDAELHVIAGMGHELPRPVWPAIVAAAVRAADRADHARP